MGSSFDALLGRLFTDGTELELRAGLNFVGFTIVKSSYGYSITHTGGGGGAGTLADTLTLGNNAAALKIINLGAPTLSTDAATKGSSDTAAAAAAASALATALAADEVIVAGAGLTRSGSTLDVVANADGSIVVAANDVKVGVINATQHGNLAGGATHANAVAGVSAGYMSATDKTKLDGISGSAAALSDNTPQGLGTADPGVGTQAARDDHVHAHGNLAGGSFHALAIAGGANGFLSGTDKTKLDAITVANLVLTSRTLTAGTGLTGGGDLSADRTFTIAYGSAAGTACIGNDARLSDDRTASGLRTASTVVVISAATAPSAGQALVATSNTAGTWQGVALSATQVIAGTGLTGGGTLAADRTFAVAYGSTSTTACVGNDSRLSDDRTASGIRTASTVVVVSAATAPSSGQALVATSSTAGTWQGVALSATQIIAGTGLTGGGALTADRTLTVTYGTSSSSACVGNDARLSDDRTGSGLRTASTVVVVSAATAPTAGQVLTASSTTLATWSTPAAVPKTPIAGSNITATVTINPDDTHSFFDIPAGLAADTDITLGVAGTNLRNTNTVTIRRSDLTAKVVRTLNGGTNSSANEGTQTLLASAAAIVDYIYEYNGSDWILLSATGVS